MRREFVTINDYERLKAFYDQQYRWMSFMIGAHESESNERGRFWRQMLYISAQFDGLCDGYKAAALPEWVRQFIIVAEAAMSCGSVRFHRLHDEALVELAGRANLTVQTFVEPAETRQLDECSNLQTRLMLQAFVRCGREVHQVTKHSAVLPCMQ